ncbi:MAG: DNA polymerase III subunit alpha [Minisyncoccia bacterium]
MEPFIHLHVHSHYSLLEGLAKIDQLIDRAKEFGMTSLAITENGNMYSTIEFYERCKKSGIKPIIGLDAFVATRTRFDKDSKEDTRRYRLTLLAKNEVGYKNLIKLVTQSNLEGFYYKPRVDKDLLRAHSEGLICLSGGPGGELSKTVVIDKKRAEEVVREHQDIFGKENYFIEIVAQVAYDNAKPVRDGLIALAKDLDVPLVGTQNVYYLNPDDRDAHEVLVGIQNEGRENKYGFGSDDYSFIDTKTATNYFKDIPEAIENTRKIADMCNLEIVLGKWVFPNIEIPEGKTADEELRRTVFEGFEKRGVEQTESALARVEYELSVIKQKGYSPYFLVVADLLHYARTHGILSNIRGSVSGSMVTYLSGITNIDPIEFQIPFERFLNPERPSAPDIDMDYADDRRDEMIEYARQKYGADHVAQIGTFGTMAARGSVRDVARAMKYEYAVGDKISKLIPMGSQGFPMTIEHALETTPELKELYDKDPDTKAIIDTAKKIEGCARHVSVHAAGVVISPSALTDFTPLQYDTKGEKKIISQYDMYTIEEAGLLKFDFLGLKNLKIIKNAINLIEKRFGILIDIDKVPLDDTKTFEMLARGETADLFQLNGDGMTKYLIDLKPSTIHDINAMVALYRPGPIQFIPEYIARKHDRSKISYLDPALEEILEKTYGILVYQDDLLMMANKLAGYTWGELDKFRKAVGKKIPEEMAAQKEKFIKGCISHSKWSESKAKQVWGWIEPFAAYGFNKAHSVSYGWVAYITAYLKANYPAEYMASVLSAEAGDTEKVAESIDDCKKLGIAVLPPNVNFSDGSFTVVPNKETGKDEIRFGLYSIKNFGEDIANGIIKERNEGGPFTSLSSFLQRVTHKNVNKKSIEALVMSGALDDLGDRGTLYGNVENILEYHRNHMQSNASQSSLFVMHEDFHDIRLKEVPTISNDQKLQWEKELLGLFISGHPLDKWKHVFEKKTQNFTKLKGEEYVDGETVRDLGCIVQEVREIDTKKGEKMCFAKLADLSGTMEVVVFPRTYKELKSLLVPDTCLSIKGKISMRNDEKSIILEEARKI